MFFRPDFITSNRIDDLFRGLSRNPMKEKTPHLVDSVRNLLVGDPDDREVRLDLFSLNIQRARDHGLASYNDCRVYYGLSRVNTFEEINPDPEIARRLRLAYQTPDNVELFVGIIAEVPVSGGVVGELGAIIIGQAFRNLRDGDRYWYEYAYPPSVRN